MEGRLLLKNCAVFRADGRVRTGMANGEMSCAIPAARLAETVDALRRNAETERTVAAYAAADAARFGSA